MPPRLNKFVVAVLAACGVVASALADGHVTAAEKGTIVASVVGAIMVWVVPNHPSGQ